MVKRTLATLALSAFTLPVFAANTPFAPFTQDPFSDVPESHASYDAIESLREINVLRGYPDGTFKPDNRINRAEFVYLITNPILLDVARLSECINEDGLKEEQKIFYPDVDRDDWYAHAVCHATKKKLVKGYPDGMFKPGDSINFVEAAKIVSTVFSLQTREEPSDRWFDPYVRRLSELNAIPASITTFGQTVTRAEMSEMIYRLHGDITDRPSRSMNNISF